MTFPEGGTGEIGPAKSATASARGSEYRVCDVGVAGEVAAPYIRVMYEVCTSKASRVATRHAVALIVKMPRASTMDGEPTGRRRIQ